VWDTLPFFCTGLARRNVHVLVPCPCNFGVLLFNKDLFILTKVVTLWHLLTCALFLSSKVYIFASVKFLKRY
jgi:hypothetical protein